jgi:hypothetical protein
MQIILFEIKKSFDPKLLLRIFFITFGNVLKIELLSAFVLHSK